MARKLSVIGNWKMHGSKNHVAHFFTDLITRVNHEFSELHYDIAICPPYVYLQQAANFISQAVGINLGAQDVSEFKSGAYTGQVSAEMLVDQGCRYVIVGHSERRLINHETDEEIANKFFVAKEAGLIPILCVGETQQQREAKQTEAVVLSQLTAVLKRRGAEGFHQAMIAYEPVWAIGTGLTATPEQADQVHDLLRSQVAKYDTVLAKSLPILYGGSVKPNNAKALFTMPNIDGALVGGASLEVADFWGICEAAHACVNVEKV